MSTDTALRKLASSSTDPDPEAIRTLVDRLAADPARKVWREPGVVRLRFADRFVGSVVDVDVDRNRDGSVVDTIRARLISAAYGGTSGALILRHPLSRNRRDQLVELALVSGIRYAVTSDPSELNDFPR